MDKEEIINLFSEVKENILKELIYYKEDKNYLKVLNEISKIKLVIEPSTKMCNAYVEKVKSFDYTKSENPKEISKYIMCIHEVRFHEEDMENLLYHEFAHVIANTFRGKDQYHNNFYKTLGESLGKPRSNFNATRPYPKYLDKEKDYKYKIICNNCGKVWYYKSKSNFVKNMQDYRCFCGEKDFKLIILH